MALVFTKYDNDIDIDGNYDSVVFDVSKFDFDVDGDTFPTDIQTDFDGILLEAGDVYFIQRETDTVDSMGTVSAISAEDLRIYAIVQDITKKDRKLHEMGLAVPGNMKMYCKNRYGITSGGATTYHVIKEGDTMKDRNDRYWKVVSIPKEPFFEQQEAYKIVIIKNIELTGSE